MKKLLFAKRADLYLQLLALVTPFIWAIVIKEDEPLFFVYFSVGTVQMISCLVNKHYLDDRLKGSMRVRFELWFMIVSYIGLCLLICSVSGLEIIYTHMMTFAILMLFIGAGMAVWYMVITAGELFLIRRLSKNENERA